MAYQNIQEESVKTKVARDVFSDFDCTDHLGRVDFAVKLKRKNKDQAEILETQYFLWAEAKQGAKADIYESLVQLILTIGKARTFDKNLPPAFLGAFDAEKTAFLPYSEVQEVFTKMISTGL